MASGSGSADITVLSWNINGLKAKLEDQKTRKTTKTKAKLDRKDALLKIFDQYDIVLLQETKIGPMKDGKDDYKDWNTINTALSEKYTLYPIKVPTCISKAISGKLVEKEGGRRRREEKATMYMTYFSSNSKGVAILINKPHTLLKASCVGGDYAWVHVQIGDQEYMFASVYQHIKYPNLICDLRFSIFSRWKAGSGAVKHRPVIGGDFNTTLAPEQDTNKNTKIKGHSARREKLKEFMSKLNLSDVWREKHETERKYTRTHYNGTMSRLDYVFMWEKDVRYVRSCDIGLRKNIPSKILKEIFSEITDLSVLSDHSPVSLTLNYPKTDDRSIQQRREE